MLMLLLTKKTTICSTNKNGNLRKDVPNIINKIQGGISMSTIYRSDNQMVEYPFIRADKINKDYWIGFYCYLNQREAERQAILDGKNIINVYTSENINDLNIKKFDAANLGWLIFVKDCWIGLDGHGYDIVLGPVANTKIRNAIKKHLLKEITYEELLEIAFTSEMRDEQIAQISFHTARALSKVHFSISYNISLDNANIDDVVMFIRKRFTDYTDALGNQTRELLKEITDKHIKETIFSLEVYPTWFFGINVDYNSNEPRYSIRIIDDKTVNLDKCYHKEQ